MPPDVPGRARRLEAIKDLVADNLRLRLQSFNLLKPKLQDEEPFVILQVGKQVCQQVPRQMRVELWMSSLLRKGVGAAAAAQYEDWLLAPVPEEAVSDMEKDLARTFPQLRKFASQEGQEALGRVLRAYAAMDPEVGYCQGMNFVAGLLLQYLPERHAFGGLVVLMQDRGLRKYYSTDMSLLQKHLWQLGRLMPPRLCSHLEASGVLPSLYAASWLMTCFSADFPASFSARIMDMIMADKMDQALLRVAEALLRHCEGRLMGAADLEDILTFLKVDLPGWDEPSLHDVLTEAFRDSWTPRQLALLASTEGAETVAEAVARITKAQSEAEDGAAAAAAAGGLAAAAGPARSGSGSEGAAGPSGQQQERVSSSSGASTPVLLPPPPRSPTCRPGSAVPRTSSSAAAAVRQLPGPLLTGGGSGSWGQAAGEPAALIDLSSPPLSPTHPASVTLSRSSAAERSSSPPAAATAGGSGGGSLYPVQQPPSSPLLLVEGKETGVAGSSPAHHGVGDHRVSPADLMWDPFSPAPPTPAAEVSLAADGPTVRPSSSSPAAAAVEVPAGALTAHQGLTSAHSRIQQPETLNVAAAAMPPQGGSSSRQGEAHGTLCSSAAGRSPLTAVMHEEEWGEFAASPKAPAG